ncbi:MAG: LapA family protein [Magnetococcales bacterium]|nr:LapA family protein [Magnetococcales bacterium]
MVRLVVSLIFAIFILIFSSQNMHGVEVRFVFGEPVEMPMVLAVAGAFVCGFALAIFTVILRTKKKRDDDDFDY